ncbi:hypothetical protein HO173_001952 [Letharia columbiana]|uniref:Endonuclease III homolog n=1 Tax=Letharia columbiana TaxID=112416 RepID=A0A8H6L9D4_9LECA|nr:uncharacterized protein HO173_001952 [Letharia columbiana]KAF6240341.1 hypothetical protein HO173_001952 [Letharia columbiana]
MKTSRIARDTAKVAISFSQADCAPRRQTRAFAASLQAFTANGEVPLPSPGKNGVKREDTSDDDSLSTLASVFEIEDVPFEPSTSRKRKRSLGSPSTAITTKSTSTSTRNSPRKPDLTSEDGTVGKLKKAKRQPAKRIVNEAGEAKIEAPANWEEIYDAVREMRKERLAPVDTMGCETLAEEHLTPRDKRFQTLIALMLSSQTKDTTNAIAMRRLQTELPSPGLTLENILQVDPIKLNELIYVVGFHNNKTRYIKAAALILRDDYAGDIPDSIEGLMSLPGVGPKMAYLCLSAAWGRTEGIGVDVHVHRISNLWGWHKTKAPEETRASLEAWLPRERWHEINHLLVGFGQTICLPVGRKCGDCTLSKKGLCPSAVVDKKKVIKKVKGEVAAKGEGSETVEVKQTEESVVVKEEDVLAEDVK